MTVLVNKKGVEVDVAPERVKGLLKDGFTRPAPKKGKPAAKPKVSKPKVKKEQN